MYRSSPKICRSMDIVKIITIFTITNQNILFTILIEISNLINSDIFLSLINDLGLFVLKSLINTIVL